MLGLCADIVVLHTSKTKKLIVDFSRRKTDVHPIYIEEDCVERVPTVKFLSRSDLQWELRYLGGHEQGPTTCPLSEDPQS